MAKDGGCERMDEVVVLPRERGGLSRWGTTVLGSHKFALMLCGACRCIYTLGRERELVDQCGTVAGLPKKKIAI